jgi:hypothetical protein
MQRASAPWVLATGLAVIGLSGCGGGDGGPSSPTPSNPSPPTDTRTIQESPSFSATVQEVFNRRSCNTAGCHGAARAANLDLRAGASYAALVNIASTNEPAFLRVVPSDPDNSYLVVKLEGRQAVGSRMPLTGGPLDSIDLTNIRNWIAQGAQNN